MDGGSEGGREEVREGRSEGGNIVLIVVEYIYMYLPLLIIILQTASTSLRVKDKIIEDHSNTIQKLKEVHTCICG